MSEQQGGVTTSGPGALFAIGGAEDKLKKRTVLQEFVEAAGGSKARIVVIPTASALGHDVVDVYSALFAALGAANVVGVRPENREDADDPAFIEPLNEATGIFMTGGNQLKLSGVVTGTAFGRAVTASNARLAASDPCALAITVAPQSPLPLPLAFCRCMKSTTRRCDCSAMRAMAWLSSTGSGSLDVLPC